MDFRAESIDATLLPIAPAVVVVDMALFNISPASFGAFIALDIYPILRGIYFLLSG